LKNILKHITLFAVLLSLAGSFVSCKKEKEKLKEGEYKAECAIITRMAFLACWIIIIETEKPIGNTDPSDSGHVSFHMDNLPDEFQRFGMRATIIFRITDETNRCRFCGLPFIEIVAIGECK